MPINQYSKADNKGNSRLLSFNILCTQVYLDNQEAHGFTWYSTNGGVCVLFDRARGTEEACEYCVSFRYNDDLECHQMVLKVS